MAILGFFKIRSFIKFIECIILNTLFSSVGSQEKLYAKMHAMEHNHIPPNIKGN